MLLLIILLPLFGFLTSILFGRFLGFGVSILTTFFIFLSFGGGSAKVSLGYWLFVDALNINWSFCFSSLTYIMLFLVVLYLIIKIVKFSFDENTFIFFKQNILTFLAILPESINLLDPGFILFTATTVAFVTTGGSAIIFLCVNVIFPVVLEKGETILSSSPLLDSAFVGEAKPFNMFKHLEEVSAVSPDISTGMLDIDPTIFVGFPLFFVSIISSLFWQTDIKYELEAIHFFYNLRLEYGHIFGDLSTPIKLISDIYLLCISDYFNTATTLCSDEHFTLLKFIRLGVIALWVILSKGGGGGS